MWGGDTIINNDIGISMKNFTKLFLKRWNHCVVDPHFLKCEIFMKKIIKLLKDIKKQINAKLVPFFRYKNSILEKDQSF